MKPLSRRIMILDWSFPGHRRGRGDHFSNPPGRIIAHLRAQILLEQVRSGIVDPQDQTRRARALVLTGGASPSPRACRGSS
jgi:hypothetical protein